MFTVKESFRKCDLYKGIFLKKKDCLYKVLVDSDNNVIEFIEPVTYTDPREDSEAFGHWFHALGDAVIAGDEYKYDIKSGRFIKKKSFLRSLRRMYFRCKCISRSFCYKLHLGSLWLYHLIRHFFDRDK
jgi:hypothetical protein